MIPIHQQVDAVTFAVKVHPRARHQRISGVHEGTLKLEITAPPVEGANDLDTLLLETFESAALVRYHSRRREEPE